MSRGLQLVALALSRPSRTSPAPSPRSLIAPPPPASGASPPRRGREQQRPRRRFAPRRDQPGLRVASSWQGFCSLGFRLWASSLPQPTPIPHQPQSPTNSIFPSPQAIGKAIKQAAVASAATQLARLNRDLGQHIKAAAAAAAAGKLKPKGVKPPAVKELSPTKKAAV
jgi:hypothetical protein